MRALAVHMRCNLCQGYVHAVPHLLSLSARLALQSSGNPENILKPERGDSCLNFLCATGQPGGTLTVCASNVQEHTFLLALNHTKLESVLPRASTDE